MEKYSAYRQIVIWSYCVIVYVCLSSMFVQLSLVILPTIPVLHCFLVYSWVVKTLQHDIIEKRDYSPKQNKILEITSFWCSTKKSMFNLIVAIQFYRKQLNLGGKESINEKVLISSNEFNGGRWRGEGVNKMWKNITLSEHFQNPIETS